MGEANTTYRNRKFAGCVLVSDNESWVGSGRYGSTGVMSEWQAFVKNQLRLGGHGIPAPKLVCIDIQPCSATITFPLPVASPGNVTISTEGRT